MTGGPALPAELSPQPDAPRDPGVDTPRDADQDAPRDSGLPRPFFADQPVQSGESDQPGQPSSPGLIGSRYGEPVSRGPQYGWPAQNRGQDGYGRPGDEPADGRPASQAPAHEPARGQLSRARPPERELRQRAIASLAFGAIALIALFGIGTDVHKAVYVLIFSAVVGFAAFVVGITALVKAHKTGSYRPRFAVGGIVLGAFATVIAVTILGFYLAFPTQVTNYFNCLRQAQTASDRQACMTKMYKSFRPSGAEAMAATTGPAGAASALPLRWPTGRRI